LTTSRIAQLVLTAALLVAGPTALLAANTGQDKPLYKWIDEKGVVHYGDSIPPQYAKQERSVLNRHGVEVGRLGAEKSDAQRAADAARDRAVTDARRRDQVLLTTYVSVQQIEQLRDQRLDLIEGQVRVTAQYLDTLQGRLQDLQARSLFYAPYSSNDGAGPMPDGLAEDLVRTIKEIRLQERNLASKRAEQGAVREHFQSDIQRYTELLADRKR
jgi:Domain of unknown function (DUF4124)